MLFSENGSTYEFGCATVYMMLMMFSVDKVKTKVGDNFFSLLVLNFHGYMPVGLGVMNFTSPLSGFTHV